MKFKITIVGLFTAILVTCIFATYTLTEKANKQLELEKLQIEIALDQYEMENYDRIYNAGNSTIEKSKIMEWDLKYNKICE